MRRLGLIGFLAFAAGCGGNIGGGGAGGAGNSPTGSAGTGSVSTGSAGTGSVSTGRGGAAGTASTGAGGQAGGHTNPLSQDLINAFVTAHNQARSGPLNPTPSPALPPVTWDYVLADSAYNYTIKCQGSGGLLSHNANRTTDYQALGGTDSYVGENIYATTGRTVQPADAVTSWMSEAPDYDYATNNISAAGHYTQVVWRQSVRIGCAIFDCPSSLTYHNTVLCDYAPGGNITNQKPY
jgi:hypothetical protein